MSIIKGITIELLTKTQTGTDDFGRPVYAETAQAVENVLVAPVTGEETPRELELTGRQEVYQLAIPKGDTHMWEGQRVRFWGRDWRVIGVPVKGIDDLVPGPWNTKVKVEADNEQ